MENFNEVPNVSVYSSNKGDNDGFPLYTSCLNFMIISDPYLQNVDKTHKQDSYQYKENSYSLIKAVMKANHKKDKDKRVDLIEEALGYADCIKIGIRLLFAFKCINVDVRTKLDFEIGSIISQLNGWKNSYNNKR